MNQESGIQTACLVYLAMLENQGHGYFWRNNSYAGHLVTPRSKVGGNFTKSGRRGSPDIVGVYKGKFIGIEVKTSTGKQSSDQKEAQTKIEESGGVYLLIRGVDELQVALQALHEPTPTLSRLNRVMATDADC